MERLMYKTTDYNLCWVVLAGIVGSLAFYFKTYEKYSQLLGENKLLRLGIVLPNMIKCVT